MSKEINARVLLKYDTAANWAQATFTPKKGEMIIYAPEGDTPVRYKIGDGTTPIGTLPFVATAGEPGANGIGIASITQTTTSTEDDGNNIVTVTLTNGATSTFTVQNGSKGGKGDPGAPGAAATVEIGSVTTGAAGSNASVTNSGTAQAAKLNFTIPKGEKGDPGDDGIASVTTTGSGNVITGLSYNESTKVLTATKGSPTLPNPKALTVGSKTYDGSSEVSITASDLGLSAAMKFIGTSDVSIEDGDVTNPITIDGVSTIVSNGNVAIYGAKEFIWNGSKWEEFGNEGNYKVKQSTYSKTATATQTIKSISQNENGDVTVETQDITFPVTSVNGQKGAVTIDVPTALADLTADSTHRTVTDAEKTTWNAKSNFSGNYNDLTNKPTIPTVPPSLPADGGNADTVDNKHASDFATAAQGTKADNALPQSGGTITGRLQVNAPIFGYNYKKNEIAPAFIFDKPGSNRTGIGANGENDTILFAPVASDDTWVSEYTQKWKFQGDVTANNFTGNLNGTATNAKYLVNNGKLTSSTDIDNFLTGDVVKYAIFKTDEMENLGFGSNDGMLLSIPWENDVYGVQLAFDDNPAGNIAFRGKSTNWGLWYKLIHTGNIGSQLTNYATKDDLTNAINNAITTALKASY